MIVLWFICLFALLFYGVVLFRTDFDDELGLLKWCVIASLILIIFVFVWMGVRIWCPR